VIVAGLRHPTSNGREEERRGEERNKREWDANGREGEREEDGKATILTLTYPTLSADYNVNTQSCDNRKYSTT